MVIDHAASQDAGPMPSCSPRVAIERTAGGVCERPVLALEGNSVAVDFKWVG